MSGNTFGDYDWGLGMAGTGGIQWIEAKDTIKHPIMSRTTPITKNYTSPNVNNAEVEKPYPEESGLENLHCINNITFYLAYSQASGNL